MHGVYPTQDTSGHGNRKGEVRDTRIWSMGMKGKIPKQGLSSARDLTIELPEGRESPYNRLD